MENKLIDILCFLRGDATVFACLPNPDVFACLENREIYSRMLELHRAGQEIDELSLPCVCLSRQFAILEYIATEGLDDAGMQAMRENAWRYAVLLARGEKVA